MKTLGYMISMISVIILATSCSADSDVLSNVESSTSTTSNVESSNNAYLSFNVNFSAAQTKASEDTTTTEIAGTYDINKCAVIVFEGDQVAYINNNVTVNSDKSLALDYQTKMKNGMSVMVVANSTVDFTGTTKSAIESTLQSTPNNLVKVGTANVDWTGFSGTTTSAIASDRSNVKTLTIALTQLTSRIELVAFNIVGHTFANNTNPEAVVLNKVQIVNTVAKSATKIGAENHSNYTTTTLTPNQTIFDGTSTFTETVNNVFAYSYQNVNPATSEKTYIVLTYTVGGKTFTSKQMLINEDGTLTAGCVYRLTVNMTITSTTINCNLSVTVKDWVKNTITTTMTEE